MHILVIIPSLLLLVVIGTAIAERTNAPYPLVLVIVGLIAGFLPAMPEWYPPNNLVLPLFLPPILFAAARILSWDDIKTNFVEIFSLSFLLVITTMVGIGLVLQWIVPGMTLGAAMVLGAIISPTDAVAATSIMNRLNTKQRLVRSLEIESLFNDAISITLYSLSVLLVFMGTIKLRGIGMHVVVTAVGGIAVGLAFAYITGVIIRLFLKNSENDLPIIMSILLAYIAYLFADYIEVSGVLAVVAAGLYHQRTERKIKARIRLSEKSFWNTIIFFLNAIIFMMIGLEFPVYLNKVSYLSAGNLIFFSLSTILVVLALRFIWVAVTAYFAKSDYTWKDVIISSWSGMRGIVSLALAIALPLSLTNTTPFPNRDLIIFLTIITILFTIIVQGLTLPLLIKILNVKQDSDGELKRTNQVYKQITQRAIKHIEKLKEEQRLTSSIAKQLIDDYYESRLLQFKLASQSNVNPGELEEETGKWLEIILDYERAQLLKMLKNKKISQEIYLRIIRKIDRDEVGFFSYQ